MSDRLNRKQFTRLTVTALSLMLIIIGVVFTGLHLCVPRTSSALNSWRNRLTSAHYDRAGTIFLSLVGSLLKPKLRLAAENAALRHQLIVLRRKMRSRAWLTNNDRAAKQLADV